MNIGEKIKRQRMKMELTQEELANRSELSKGFISQLERDLTSPSIATLIDILECLGTNLKDFFGEDSDSKIVFRSDDVFVQENEADGHSIHWLIPNAQKNMMEPILLHLRPKGRSSLYQPHEGELFGYVLNGSVTVTVGEQVLKAKKGESFYYKASAPHFIENHSAAEAKVLWVCAPPHF